MICKECGNNYPDYFTYCPNDGHTLGNNSLSVTYKVNEYCTTCNINNKEGYSYCSNCGTSMLQGVEKRGFQEAITKTIIPEIKRNVSRAEPLKVINLLHLNFARDWKLFWPIFIAIITVLAVPNFLLKSILGNLYNNNNSDISLFLNIHELSKELSDQYGYHIDVPNFLNIFSLANLSHGVQFYLSFNNYDYMVDKSFGTFNNISSAMIILPILALFVSGIVLGMVAKKNSLSIMKGIIVSIFLYVSFMLVSSFLADTELAVNAGDRFKVSLIYSKKDALFSSFILSSLLISFSALLSYHFGNIKQLINKTNSLVSYFIYTLAITFIGVFVNVIHTYVTTKNKDILYESDLLQGAKALFYVPTGIMHYIMTQFNTFKISLSNGNNISENVTLNWFFGKQLNVDWYGVFEFFQPYLLSSSFNLTKFILLLITVLLVSSGGYMLFNTHKLIWKEIGKLSITFAVIQCLLLYISNITIQGIFDNEQTNIFLGFSYFSTLLTSFIFGAIFFYAGGYLRKLLN